MDSVLFKKLVLNCRFCNTSVRQTDWPIHVEAHISDLQNIEDQLPEEHPIELEHEETPRNPDAEIDQQHVQQQHQQQQEQQQEFSVQIKVADLLVGNIVKRIKPGKTLLVIFDCKLFKDLDKGLMNLLLSSVISVLTKAS